MPCEGYYLPNNIEEKQAVTVQGRLTPWHSGHVLAANGSLTIFNLPIVAVDWWWRVAGRKSAVWPDIGGFTAKHSTEL